MHLYKYHFCLIWKSEGVSFKDAVKDLKEKYNLVDNYRTEENVKSLFEYIYKPNKLETHLTNFIVYDLETHNTDRARHFVFCFYRLKKLAGRYNRDLTSDETEKCKKDNIAFDGDNCVEKAFDYCLKLKADEYKDKKRQSFRIQSSTSCS